MNPADRTRQLTYALNHFSDHFHDDGESVLRWLERHKLEIEWANVELAGDARAAAKDLLKLIELKSEGGSNSPQLAIDIKHDLKAIADSVRTQEAAQPAATGSVAPGARLLWATFLVNFIGVLVGTSTGVIGRVFAATGPPASAGSSPKPLPLQAGPQVAVVLHVLQTVIIFFFILVHRKWLHDLASRLTDAVPIAKKTLEQFKRGWLFMWYGWLALYSWFSIAAIQSWRGHGSPSIESVSDVLDVVSGFALWWCYLVLDIPSVNIADAPKRDKAFWHAVWISVFAGILCAFAAVMDRHFQWGYSGVALVGLYNALGLASLTGRFGSHYMGLPRWMLLFLYVYSMLQIFYSFLPVLQTNTALWTPAVYVLALILKMVLALAGATMMQNGGLLRYLDAAQFGLLEAGRLSDQKWSAVKAAVAQ